MDVSTNLRLTFLHSSLLQSILKFIHLSLDIIVILLQFVVLGDTLISGTWFRNGFWDVIMVLILPNIITAVLQLWLCFASSLDKGYDFQHKREVLEIAATPGKKFRFKVEVMSTISRCQSSNTLLYHVIVLECEFRMLFEKHVPGDPSRFTKHLSIFSICYRLINPHHTPCLKEMWLRTTSTYQSMIMNELLYLAYFIYAYGVLWRY